MAGGPPAGKRARRKRPMRNASRRGWRTRSTDTLSLFLVTSPSAAQLCDSEERRVHGRTRRARKRYQWRLDYAPLASGQATFFSQNGLAQRDQAEAAGEWRVDAGEIQDIA